jgi:Alr-MurF fusion protein
MSSFTLSVFDAIKVTKASVAGCSNTEWMVDDLLIDSRKFAAHHKTMFFAMRTKNRDGHDFVNELYEKGVRAFVVEETYLPDLIKLHEATFLIVKSPLRALQAIAAYHRNLFQIPSLGITGSNGKTIVKEWLSFLLSKHITVARSPKSYNSQIGVPLSVVLLEKLHNIGVFEAGISQKGEMEFLENVIQPQFGVFTNIGPAHDENFLNQNEKIFEKLKLFVNCRHLIYCKDHTDIHKAIISNKQLQKTAFYTWGKSNNNNIQLVDVQKYLSNTKMVVAVNNQTINFEIPFADDASVENAMHCFAMMCLLGYKPKDTAKLMQSLPPVAMRLELNDGVNNCIVINDSYNSDLHSLAIALDFLQQQQQNRNSTLILSDIQQTGKTEQDLYAQAADLIKSKKIHKFIGIGAHISSQKNLFKDIPQVHFFSDTDSFLTKTHPHSFQNEIILIKGARDFAFERIAGSLEQKSHQTVLEINMNAIVHNLQVYRSMLKTNTMVMAMVKAFSYGTGSYEIAALLEYHHVNYLGVAYADEGVELRNKGIGMPIMVMAPEESSMEAIINHQLEPEIYSFQSLRWLGNFEDVEVKIHIKFDTGMHRLGFDRESIPGLCEQLKQMPNVQVVSVFSHLAASDDEAHNEFTRAQIHQFDEMYIEFSQQLNIHPMRHILNSAGILNFTESQYDMVRLGLGLYGVQSLYAQQLHLLQVVRLKTKVIQVKHIKKGESIGYGLTYKAMKDITIAIIPIGYADGFKRVLSNGRGCVWIQNKACPVVGNVCMDMTMVDVSHIQSPMTGDEVVVFDENFTVSQFAQSMEVIPYEALTSISHRVKRKYVME